MTSREPTFEELASRRFRASLETMSDSAVALESRLADIASGEAFRRLRTATEAFHYASSRRADVAYVMGVRRIETDHCPMCGAQDIDVLSPCPECGES